MAPEIINIKNFKGVRLGLKSDVYSVGAVYYELMYNEMLFNGGTSKEIVAKNRTANVVLKNCNKFDRD